MTITSLSLTFVYSNTADVARARGVAAPAPATPPVTAPASTASTACDHHGYETPRRSPLYRALMDALESLVAPASASQPSTAAATPIAPPASTAPANATSSTATTAEAPATSAANDGPVGIDAAVVNFARALMQALRGAMHGDGGSDGERHGHRHHDHGRRAWGDPAQQIAQLGAQVGAATPPVEPAPAAATPDATAATPAASTTPIPAPAPATSGSVLDPAAATSPTSTADASSTIVHVTLALSGPAAPALTRTQQALLDAFGTLQTARGKPKDDSKDEKSLSAQLSAFLQELADKLRLGDENAADATQPGALLHLTA